LIVRASCQDVTNTAIWRSVVSAIGARQSHPRRDTGNGTGRPLHDFNMRRVIEVWQYVGDGEATAAFWA